METARPPGPASPPQTLPGERPQLGQGAGLDAALPEGEWECVLTLRRQGIDRRRAPAPPASAHRVPARRRPGNRRARRPAAGPAGPVRPLARRAGAPPRGELKPPGGRQAGAGGVVRPASRRYGQVCAHAGAGAGSGVWPLKSATSPSGSPGCPASSLPRRATTRRPRRSQSAQEASASGRTSPAALRGDGVPHHVGAAVGPGVPAGLLQEERPLPAGLPPFPRRPIAPLPSRTFPAHPAVAQQAVVEDEAVARLVQDELVARVVGGTEVGQVLRDREPRREGAPAGRPRPAADEHRARPRTRRVRRVARRTGRGGGRRQGEEAPHPVGAPDEPQGQRREVRWPADGDPGVRGRRLRRNQSLGRIG